MARSRRAGGSRNRFGQLGLCCVGHARPWKTLSRCPGHWRAREADLVSLWCALRDSGFSSVRYPDAPFRHLQRLTDNIGLLQHADGVVPLHGHGYSVDDVARGLLVVCREPSPSQELVVLGRRYLYFLAQAQALGGKFRNHLGYDRRWHDQPGTEGGWGISLWAL